MTYVETGTHYKALQRVSYRLLKRLEAFHFRDGSEKSKFNLWQREFRRLRDIYAEKPPCIYYGEATRRSYKLKQFEKAREIILEVAINRKVTEAQILGRRRDRHIVVARHEACYRIRSELRLSLPDIGKIMGRDHTTILHGVRKHCELHGLPVPGEGK